MGDLVRFDRSHRCLLDGSFDLGRRGSYFAGRAEFREVLAGKKLGNLGLTACLRCAAVVGTVRRELR